MIALWHKLRISLDVFLWRRGIGHPVIRPLLRNLLFASALCLVPGAALYGLWPWLFWFGAGILCLGWLFWGWARFFSRFSPGEYGSAFLRVIIFRFLGRLMLIAVLLYIALVLCAAPPGAILAGMICGTGLALATFALLGQT